MLSGETGIIYCYTNKKNGKCYIGQTINEGQRKTRHLREAMTLNSQKSFHKAIRKYGWDNFEYNILEYVSTDMLDEREIFWIGYFNSYNKGYNMTIGGSSIRGYKHTEKWIKTMSIKNSGDNNPFFW